MARNIVITGGKGGVGKTSVVAGLGVALCRLGKRVCVLDADVGLNNLDVTLGTEGRIVYDVTDVVTNRCRPRQALVEVSDCAGLFVLPSVKGDREAITGQALREIARNLSATFDFILIDCPAGIDNGFRRAVSAADEGIVVTTPHLPAVRDADKVVSLLKAYEYASTGLVLNRVRGDLVLGGDSLSPEQLEELLACRVLGVIPEDDEIALGASDGRPLREGTDGARAFAMLARVVTGEDTAVFDVRKKYKGLFGPMKRRLRRIV